MGFFGDGDFSFWDRSKNSRALGIFSNLGIFIPGIGDFLKSCDFYPRDWGYFQTWGFFYGDRGFLFPRIGVSH